MRVSHFLTFCIAIVVLFSCKKQKQAELPSDEPCNSVTTNVNDSLVALISRYMSTSGVEIIKVKNGITTVVASQSGYEFWGPSLSPDKQKFICFRSVTGNALKVDDYETAELWMFNIDGSNGHAITTLTHQGWHAMGTAKWAPNGTHIVLAAEKMETDAHLHWNIYLLDTAGTLATRMNTRLGYFSHPSFANGSMTEIAYTAWPDGVVTGGDKSNCEIHRATVTTGYQLSGEYKITDNTRYDFSPSYSPDNANIVYTEATTLSTETASILWVANYATNTKNKILDNNNINENPVWCSTNNKIYFINKITSYCIRNVARVETNGSAKQAMYRLLNAQFYHIDVK